MDSAAAVVGGAGLEPSTPSMSIRFSTEHRASRNRRLGAETRIWPAVLHGQVPSCVFETVGLNEAPLASVRQRGGKRF